MKLSFFEQMIPPEKTQQEHRVGVSKSGKPYIYEDAELKAARAKLSAHIGIHKPKEKMQGPLRLSVCWYFSVKGKHKSGEYKTSKPDTDNLNKMLKDVMTENHFWEDDAQVCIEQIQKMWSDVPGIWIGVEELTADGPKEESKAVKVSGY